MRLVRFILCVLVAGCATEPERAPNPGPEATLEALAKAAAWLEEKAEPLVRDVIVARRRSR